jgi:C4-dicarboxylate transporter DctM subunit
MNTAVILSFFIIILLVILRIPIAVCLIAVGFVGIWYLQGFSFAVGYLKSVPYDFAASWTLSSLPMYLLLGYFAFHSEIGARLFHSVRACIGRIPGTLAITTIAACACFGAICGSSGATAAAIGRVAIPEMLKDGYEPGLATGCVAASGTLGSLIPPSILMIIYAVLTQESIGRCYLAGFLPGILSAIILCGMVFVRVKLNPQLAPTLEIKAYSWKERMNSIGRLWDLFLVCFIVFGGIYSGVFTATEAGACGAFSLFLIGILLKRLDWKKIKESVLETLVITAMVLIVAVGANLYTRFLALGGLNEFLVQWATTQNISAITLIVALSCAFFILGMFLDPIGCMLLTIPTLLPVFQALHINLVWLCILVVKNMEIGLVTPPVGLNVYVIKGITPSIPIETIFRGIGWFVLMEIITLAILIAFPQISLVLPNMLEGIG